MCEYDSYSEFQSSRIVKLQKSRRCESCRQTMRAGESAVYYAGKADDFYYFYRCKICDFLTSAAEGTPFHACDDGSDDPRLNPAHPAYIEVQRAFSDGRDPDPGNVWDPTWEELRKREEMLLGPDLVVVCND